MPRIRAIKVPKKKCTGWVKHSSKLHQMICRGPFRGTFIECLITRNEKGRSFTRCEFHDPNRAWHGNAYSSDFPTLDKARDAAERYVTKISEDMKK
jgi:hypothetical protein